jgi:hypothetical protein
MRISDADTGDQNHADADADPQHCPIGMPRNDFEFFRIFVELFVFVIDSPAINTPGSRLESFRFGSFCKYKSHVPRELK